MGNLTREVASQLDLEIGRMGGKLGRHSQGAGSILANVAGTLEQS